MITYKTSAGSTYTIEVGERSAGAILLRIEGAIWLQPGDIVALTNNLEAAWESQFKEKPVWCIVRRTHGFLCGPLQWATPGGLCSTEFGNHLTCEDQLNVATFPSMSDAEEAIRQSSYRPACAIDSPAMLSSMHFFAKVFDHYNGTTVILYDGGDYFRARDFVKDHIAKDPEHNRGRYKATLEILMEGAK